MPKVITGAGLQEFIESGKHETIAVTKKEAPKEAPALEVKKEAPPVDVKADKSESKTESDSPYKGLSKEETDWINSAPDETERVRRLIGKHNKAAQQEKGLRAQAEEAAADAEAFAKSQFEERRLIEGERDRLKQELEAERKTKAAPKEPELKQPTKDDSKYQVNGQFDWDTYTNDVAEFKVKKAFAEDAVKRAEEAQKAAQDKEAAERAEAAAKFKAKADKIDGFAEKLAGSQVWFPNAVLEYITESDDGPEIVLALLDDPATADRISKLRPIKAIAEIGKLQKTLGEKAKAVIPAAPPAVVERGGAPPPITPISGGSGTINTDPAKMNFRELREYERAKRKKH